MVLWCVQISSRNKVLAVITSESCSQLQDPQTKKLHWRPKLDVPARTQTQEMSQEMPSKNYYASLLTGVNIQCLNAHNLGISGYKDKTFLADLKRIFNIASVYLGIRSLRVFQKNFHHKTFVHPCMTLFCLFV